VIYEGNIDIATKKKKKERKKEKKKGKKLKNDL